MIKSVNLRNFQSHKNTTIEFSEGVNAIVGLSCSGKSAILRGLNWVFNNAPGGDVFMSNWNGGNTSVAVTFDDETEVSRTRGKSINQYALTLPGKDTQIYEGFGQGNIPKPVADALNIHDFNMRFQHQGAFLLSESAGKISQYLNKVARLDSIDIAISNIDSTLRSERQVMKAEDSNIERLEPELEQYKYLEEAEKLVILVEAMQKRVQEDSSRYNALFDGVEDIENAQKELSPIQTIAGFSASLLLLLNEDAWIEDKKLESDELRSHIWDIGGIGLQLKTFSEILKFKNPVESLLTVDSELVKALTNADALNAFVNDVTAREQDIQGLHLALEFKNQVEEALDRSDSYFDDWHKSEHLNSDILLISDMEKKLTEESKRKADLKKEFDDEWPDICPLCGKGD